jgi:hypothetical protein
VNDRPESRKTHVVRLVGTNKNGDRLDDIWIDVERIDQMTIRTQTSLPQFHIENQWQQTNIKFKWNDDPDGGTDELPYDPEAERTETERHKILKVCSPDEDDLENPEEWVPVKVITRILMDQKSVGKAEKRFVYKTLENARKSENRRMVHYDTNIDDDAQAAFDADTSRTAYVVPRDQYQRDDSTKDEDDYVEHEVVMWLEKHINEEAYSPGGANQDVQLRMKNQFLIDQSDEAKLDAQGPQGYDPPYRMDPYQNIINCSFGGLAVEFFDGAA